ncbi:MAG: hypothetical protein FJW31_06700, partial [Acidobacteria bacterium]|nr:hypothetical protein [Acidobacteriota bacterium]
ASKSTVARLLEQMNFRLRVNRKQVACSKSPDRHQQFLYIAQQICPGRSKRATRWCARRSNIWMRFPPKPPATRRCNWNSAPATPAWRKHSPA